MVNDLGYDIKFLVSEKDFGKIEKKVFVCVVIKMDWFILFMYQIKHLKTPKSYR